MKSNAQSKKLAVAPAKPAPAPVAHPNLDPMDISTWRDLSPEQQQWIRAELLARIQRKFADMSTCAIQSVAWYVHMEIANHGCITPAENFIDSLIMTHRIRGLTPESAASTLEEFQEEFESIAECTKRFNNLRYPALVNSACGWTGHAS